MKKTYKFLKIFIFLGIIINSLILDVRAQEIIPFDEISLNDKKDDLEVDISDSSQEAQKDSNDSQDSAAKEDPKKTGFINWLKSHKLLSAISSGLVVLGSGGFFRGRSVSNNKASLAIRQKEVKAEVNDLDNKIKNLELFDTGIKFGSNLDCPLCYSCCDRVVLNEASDFKSGVCVDCLSEWYKTALKTMRSSNNSIDQYFICPTTRKPYSNFTITFMSDYAKCNTEAEKIACINRIMEIISKQESGINSEEAQKKALIKKEIQEKQKLITQLDPKNFKPNQIDKFLMDSYEFLAAHKKEVAIGVGTGAIVGGVIGLIYYLYKKGVFTSKPIDISDLDSELEDLDLNSELDDELLDDEELDL